MSERKVKHPPQTPEEKEAFQRYKQWGSFTYTGLGSRVIQSSEINFLKFFVILYWLISFLLAKCNQIEFPTIQENLTQT